MLNSLDILPIKNILYRPLNNSVTTLRVKRLSWLQDYYLTQQLPLSEIEKKTLKTGNLGKNTNYLVEITYKHCIWELLAPLLYS